MLPFASVFSSSSSSSGSSGWVGVGNGVVVAGLSVCRADVAATIVVCSRTYVVVPAVVIGVAAVATGVVTSCTISAMDVTGD